MSRHGAVKNYRVNCKSEIKCDFQLTLNKDMMPQSTVVVYNVKDSSSLQQGETVIKTMEIGRNTVN